MATQNIPQPITHVFKEISIGKYKSTKHYELVEVENNNSYLSKKLNLSKNRNFALSMPDYWLKIRKGKKWSKYITGLFKTSIRNLYKGDHNKRQNLIIFKFSDDSTTVTVYYFKNYYTKDLSKVLPFINE